MLNEGKVSPDLESNREDSGCDWYLDLGASNHMTCEKKVFTELDKKTIGTVKFDDDSLVEICS